MTTIAERVHKDPVCQMRVSPGTAAEASEYQGKTYYFCSGLCRHAFESDPESYAERGRKWAARSRANQADPGGKP